MECHFGQHYYDLMIHLGMKKYDELKQVWVWIVNSSDLKRWVHRDLCLDMILAKLNQEMDLTIDQLELYEREKFLHEK